MKQSSTGTSRARLRGVLAVAALGTVVGAGAVAILVPAASAAPPASDDRGYVDSTARCDPPSKAVAYGYTVNSRIAICKDDASGQLQYRGVRVSDGARLILAATTTGHGYVAENDGITYTVTSGALTVSSGSQQIRSEPMVDFHGSAGTSSGTSATSTSAGTAPTQPSAVPVTPSTSLPPPLPAEVGGGSR